MRQNWQRFLQTLWLIALLSGLPGPHTPTLAAATLPVRYRQTVADPPAVTPLAPSLPLSNTLPVSAVATDAGSNTPTPALTPTAVTTTAIAAEQPPYILALPLVALSAAPNGDLANLTQSVQVLANGGIWLLPAEIAALPMSGPAWLQVKAAADTAAGSPTLADQDSDANVYYLAKALVFARTGTVSYRDPVVNALRTLVTGNTEDGGRTLALGRELTAYVIAADLIDLKSYDPVLDAQFRTKLRQLLTKPLEGMTLQTTHEVRPNNWGSHAGAARAAVALYLGDRAELDRTWLIFRGYVGDQSTYRSFEFGDLDWQADPLAPVAINPVGATKQGYNIDGALPEEMRRGGGFQWPPIETGYAWEALQGAIVQAQLLQRAGYPAWEWQDRALLRAVLFLKSINWPADGDDGWQPWLINYAYQAEVLPALNPALPGKNMGWTNWTHATWLTPTPTATAVPPTATPTATPVPPTATPTATVIPPTATSTSTPTPTRPPTNQAPLVDAGADQEITLPTNSITLVGRASDDGLPVAAALFYAWSKVSGPGAVTWGSANQPTTTVNFATAGLYRLRLIVSDSALSASADVQITVKPGALPTMTPTAPPTSPTPSPTSSPTSSPTASPTPSPTPSPTSTPLPPPATATATPVTPTVTPTATPTTGVLGNREPMVDAGVDQSVTLPTASVQLAGNVTDETLPDPAVGLTYAWIKVSGPGQVVFTNANALNPTVTFSGAGSYGLRLIVSDGQFSASDDVQVTVNAAQITHQPPVVDAGPDQSITLPVSSVHLLGSASDDSLPNPPALLLYAWSKVSGPGPVTFSSLNTLQTTANFSVAGVYVLRLIASDGALSASDDLQITVNPSAPVSLNFAPTQDSGINAGSPTTAYGATATYRVRSGSPEYRVYLQFNVHGLSRPIQNARLRLYVTDGSNQGGAFYPVANELLNASTPWTEQNLTWANAPLLAGTALRTLGPVTMGTWVEVDVTAAISGDGLYSFAIKSTSTDSAYYSAKEGKNPPQLVITLTTP